MHGGTWKRTARVAVPEVSSSSHCRWRRATWQRASDSTHLPAFPQRRVLIVDDNADAADTLGELLRTLGATVSVAHSGRAALDALDSFEPDAVVLDIGMPEMDGYEVARRIHRGRRHRYPCSSRSPDGDRSAIRIALVRPVSIITW